MFRIHATAIPTQVIEYQALRNRASEKFVRVSMHHVRGQTLAAHDTIPVFTDVTGPIPTTVSDFREVVKPFFGGPHEDITHGCEFFPALVALLVVRIAQAAAVVLALTPGEFTGTLRHVDSLLVVRSPGKLSLPPGLSRMIVPWMLTEA
jgi:hypothetical protein